VNLYLTSWLALLSLSCASVAQTGASETPAASTTKQPTQAAAQPQVAPTTNFTSSKGFVLEEGTPVRLRINRTISSADEHTGDNVDFEVLETSA
jgi:hypothetical protein